MALQNDEQSSVLLDSQAHILNYAYSFVRSMSLKCAIELEIPDIIHRHGVPMSLSELVDALPINKERSQYVYRLMRILVHAGFFSIQSLPTIKGEEREGYSLTPASRLLLKEEPLNITPLFLVFLDPIMLDPWQNMSKWLRNENDINPFQTTHGKMAYELAVEDPKLYQSINEGMASDGRLVASVILKHCKSIFEELDSVVDVGGGTGTFAKCIAEAFPNLSYINFDLPQVVKGLEGSKNLSFVGGDMFETIPKAQAVLFKWVLHNWSDEECVEILKRCKEAIPSKENGGKVIIIEIVLKDEELGNKTLETQLFYDMFEFTTAKGRQRSEKDWAKLFHDACFSGYKIYPVLGIRSVIEVYP
ncbi:putative trans-resveratrol di-O-methyltransferase [Helianthus annuus]|nr:putative trans-resveratrol di-O-methyltransferase [Helianthus annuus]